MICMIQCFGSWDAEISRLERKKEKGRLKDRQSDKHKERKKERKKERTTTAAGNMVRLSCIAVPAEEGQL